MPVLNLGYGGTFTWVPAPLNVAAVRAFDRVVRELGDEFSEVIKEVGAFPQFPDSDIVDTGELLEAQKLIKTGPDRAEYEWGVEYALFVHEGYTMQNGIRQPGRHWTRLAMERYHPYEKFRIYYQAELAALGIFGRLPPGLTGVIDFFNPVI